MSVMPWGMSWFLSTADSISFSAFLGLLLLVVLFHLTVAVAMPQEGRLRKRQRRGSNGNARAFVVLKALQPLETHCPVHLETGDMHEVVHQFNMTLKDLTRHLDMLNWEMSEGSDISWTSIMSSEVGSSSRVSPPPSREDPHTAIMASKASSPAEVSLSRLSDNSWTTIMASNVGSSSRASLPTLLDEADMAPASSVQPCLEHPRTDLEEQPDTAAPPACREEVVTCLEASSVQQHQQALEIQLDTPTPLPEVPEIHSKEMETPLHHDKGQETLEALIPESKLEQELGQPVNVDETPQNVPAAAPPTPQQPEKRDVMVVPIVRDLPFLDEAVKRELENHIVKMKIQKRYGLHTRILECEQSFEKLILR